MERNKTKVWEQEEFAGKIRQEFFKGVWTRGEGDRSEFYQNNMEGGAEGDVSLTRDKSRGLMSLVS